MNALARIDRDNGLDKCSTFDTTDFYRILIVLETAFLLQNAVNNSIGALQHDSLDPKVTPGIGDIVEPNGKQAQSKCHQQRRHDDHRLRKP